MIVLDSEMNGSTPSISPWGENVSQWCLSISTFSFGSTFNRCAQASASSVSVVDVGSGRPGGRLAGMVTFRFATAGVAGDEGYATTLDPPGVDSGALVACGSAGRASGCMLFGSGMGDDEARGTFEGVGVRGGGLDAGLGVWALRRLVVGV